MASGVAAGASAAAASGNNGSGGISDPPPGGADQDMEMSASQEINGAPEAPAEINADATGLPRGQMRSSEVGIEEIDPEGVHAASDIVVSVDQEPATGAGDGGTGADAAAAPPRR